MMKLGVKVGWSFIKTPDMIELYIGDSVERYNPETGEYESDVQEIVKLPCLATFMSKAKQFEEYGSRDREIMIVRFTHKVPKFDKAVLNNKTYRQLEETQVNKKRAYRLERVRK